jgi:hypothetical protein
VVVGEVTVVALLWVWRRLRGALDKRTASPDCRRTLEQSLQAHEALARRAKGSSDDLCKLVDDSSTLVRPLGDGVVDLTRKGSAAREQRLWDQLDRRTTGMYFVMSDVFSRSGVDYVELARLAGADDASQLRAMAELDGVSQGFENRPGVAGADDRLRGMPFARQGDQDADGPGSIVDRGESVHAFGAHETARGSARTHGGGRQLLPGRSRAAKQRPPARTRPRCES